MSERNALARVVDSPQFTAVIVATIVVNAVVLGLQTTTASSTAGATGST